MLQAYSSKTTAAFGRASCKPKAVTKLGKIGASLILVATSGASEIQMRIATRDDVDDSEYVKLGEPYAALGRVRAGNRSCSAALVRTTDGSTKIVTSAHCVDWDSDNVSDVSPPEVRFQTGVTLDGPNVDAVDIQVQKWDGEGGLDLAVITLADFEPGTGPIPLTVSAEKPVGAVVRLVGYGTHGTGLPPFDNLSDTQRRAATNAADEFFDAGDNAGQIRIDFDHPDDPEFSTMGDAFPTALEGGSGIGDSGGPLLLDDKVIGVLHGGINPTDFEFSEYGDVSIFSGVFHEPNTAFLTANNVLVTGLDDATVAVTVDSIAQPGQPFIAGGGGSPAKDGSVVRIGTFPAGFDPAAADLMDVARQWLPFGETEIRAIAGQPGRFSGTCSANGTAFANARIYWWILETSSGKPAPDLNNVTEWGLFSSSDVRWVFPSPGLPPPANATLLSSSEVDQAIHNGDILTDRLVLETVNLLSYESWTADAFPDGLPANLLAPTADPDADGFNNEMEWIIGTSPLVPNHGSPLQIEYSADAVTIQYTRSRALPANSHHFEFSTELMDWHPAILLSETVESVDEATEHAVVRVGAGSTTGYWRLAVTK